MANLLIISGFWPSKSNTISGIFVVQQVAAMEKLGFNLTVIRPTPILKPGAQPLAVHQLGLGPQTRLIDVPFLSLPPSRLGPSVLTFNWYSCAYSVMKSARRLSQAHDYQGVLCHGLMMPSWRSYVRAPSALVLHGIDPLFQSECCKKKWKQRLRLVWNQVDWVILVGEFLKGYASQLLVPHSKLRVIYNGTDIPEGKNVLSLQQRPLSERRIVLSVSNLTALKGIDFNLRALAQIKSEHPGVEWEYRVVGDGPEKHRLRYLAQQLGIQDRVVFLGRLPYSRTMQEMERCDIFSLPSWGEAFGIVYLEAMARGRPVIGCAGCGAQAIVRHSEDGYLVKPKDVGSLKEALTQLLCDPCLAASFGRSAYERARQFTWSNNVRQVLDLLKCKPFHS